MRFEAIWFRYDRRADWTLREVDALAEPGQTIVVLGPNGAGKSTLLQVAAGILRPGRGAVRDRPPVVGWVPERFPAAQPFTTIGYLRSMAALRGLAPGRADHWLERLGLARHADTPLGDLSKGTAQKVGVAQALLAPPGLLVLDEPWEGLDAGSRGLIPEIVGEVTGAGGVVMVSDHRGEITSLPGAVHWTVDAGRLTVETPAHPGIAPSGTAHPGSARPAGAGFVAPAGPVAPAGSVMAAASAEADADEVIVEVAVRRHEAEAEVVRLRASGHRVLGVREKPAPAKEDR